MYLAIKTFIILTNNYIKDTYILSIMFFSFGYGRILELGLILLGTITSWRYIRSKDKFCFI